MNTRRAPGRRTSSPVDFWIRIVLIVAAIAPFAGTLLYGYIYDDAAIILANPTIQGWKSLIEVWRHPYWVNGGPDTSGLYRPLLMTVFAIIWNGAHKFAIAFHLVAVALHTVATLLLFKLLRRGVGQWAAAGAALWFAVHPVHVEAVANISNVSEVLVCVWTLLLALWVLPPPDPRNSSWNPPDWTRSAVAALLYAAALLTKESGAVAPALALLAAVGWRPLSQSSLRDAAAQWREWLRVIVLWAAALVAVLIVRRIVLGGVVGTVSIAAPGIDGLSASRRVWSMLALGGRIGELLLWPTTQNPHYGPSVLPSPPGITTAAVLTIAAIVVAIVASWRIAFRARQPDGRPLVGLAWTLIAFLPASNLLTATGQLLAERTLYVSSVGVAMLVAWCLDRVLERAAARGQPRPRARAGARIATLVTVGLVVAACVRGYVRTRDYARVWRDRRTVFLQMVRADSLSYRGYQLLAIEAKDHQRSAEAAELYARSYALRPSDPTLLTDYGEYLLETGRARYALAIGDRLFRHSDMWTDARAVTLLLNATGRVWGVDSVLATAQRLNTRAPSARAALFIGMAYDAKGDSTSAKAAYRAGLRLAPHDSALAAHAMNE